MVFSLTLFSTRDGLYKVRIDWSDKDRTILGPATFSEVFSMAEERIRLELANSS